MKRTLRSFLAIVAGLGLASHVHAASIVSYVNPVATADIGVMEFSGCDLGDGTEVVNGTYHVVNWTPATPVMSSAVNVNYLSHPLYAIAQAGAEGVTKDWTSSRLLDGVAGSYDIQWIVKDSVPNEVISMSVLQYVKAEDFVNATGGEPLSELSVTFLDNETKAEGALRFAVKNAGQWYVSATNSSDGAGTLTLSNPQDANQWGAITPATSSSDTVVTPAGVTFDTAGSALTSIEAIGFYFDAIDTPVGARVRVRVSNFTADTAGSAPSSDSARVLAVNVDAEKADFEYVSPKIGFNLSLNAALDGVSSGGSTDESYGSFFDPSAAVASPDEYPWQANGANSLVAEISITNVSSQSLKLDGLYFDMNRVSSNAIRQIRLDYIGGDLGAAGQVYNTTLADTASVGLWKTCDLTFGSEGDVPGILPLGFNALADRTLGANETATFRLTLQTSTDAGTEPDAVLVDNIALIGDFFNDNELVNWGSPGLFFGDPASELLNLGANNAVTNGDLFIRNYTPSGPLYSRQKDGYYQGQNINGLMQTGNQGLGAESRPFRFYKITPASPTTGAFLLTVTPAGDATNGTAIFQSSLVYFDAGDFYDTFEPGETISSLSMDITDLKGDSGAAVRFAVKDSGQWYISNSRSQSIGTFSLALPANEGAWGALSESTSSSTSLMTASGVSFDTAGASFANIQAIGFFMEGSGGNIESQVKVQFASFTAQAGPIPIEFPDPSVLAFNVDDDKEFEYIKSGVDFSLILVSEGNSSSASGGSLDGSLGSFPDPVSADTNSAARPWAGRGTASFIAEMTIGNLQSDSALDLGGFYFDLYGHKRLSTPARHIELEYIGGDLSAPTGTVYKMILALGEFDSYFENEGETNEVEIIPWTDFDWTFAEEGPNPSTNTAPVFNALADTSLAFGESATFRFTIKSSTTDLNEDNQTRLDNIAFLGSLNGIGFGSWINGFGLAQEDKGEEDDPDSDGVNNLYEYGLNSDPNDNGDAGAPSVIEVAEDVFTYVHPQRADPGNGLIYYLELNHDLVYGIWTNDGYSVIDTNVTGLTLDYVTNAIPTNVKAEQFIRLIIENPAP